MIINNFFSERPDEVKKRQNQQKQKKGGLDRVKSSTAATRAKDKSLNRLLGLKNDSIGDKYGILNKKDRQSLVENYNQLDELPGIENHLMSKTHGLGFKVPIDANDGKFNRTSSKNFLLSNYYSPNNEEPLRSNDLRSNKSPISPSNLGKHNTERGQSNNWAVVGLDSYIRAASTHGLNGDDQNEMTYAFKHIPQDGVLLQKANSSFAGGAGGNQEASYHLIDNSTTINSSLKGINLSEHQDINSYGQNTPGYAIGTVVSNNKNNQARRFSKARPVTASQSKNLSLTGKDSFLPKEQQHQQYNLSGIGGNTSNKQWLKNELLMNKLKGELIDENENSESFTENSKQGRKSMNKHQQYDKENNGGAGSDNRNKKACSTIIQECENLLSKIQAKETSTIKKDISSLNLTNTSSSSQKNALGRISSQIRPQSVKRDSSAHNNLKSKDTSENQVLESLEEQDDDSVTLQKIANNLLLKKLANQQKNDILDKATQERQKIFSSSSSGKFYSKKQEREQKVNYSDLSRIQEQEQQEDQINLELEQMRELTHKNDLDKSTDDAVSPLGQRGEKNINSLAKTSNRFYDLRERAAITDKKEKLAQEAARAAAIIAKNVQKFSGHCGIQTHILQRPDSKRKSTLESISTAPTLGIGGTNTQDSARVKGGYSRRVSELNEPQSNKNEDDSNPQGTNKNVKPEDKKRMSGIRPATAATTSTAASSQQSSSQQKSQMDQKAMERYEVKNTIGKGSYAIVKLGRDILSDRQVAIKMYDKYKLIDPQKRNNVKREVAILRKLDHQNIIKLYQTIDTRATVNLVMEYISSTSLRHFMKALDGKLLEEKFAKLIFRQLVSALAYCHDDEIIHRDIKLENVMLDTNDNYNIKLIDFGFAIKVPPEKKLNIFCGTPSYMSPEITKKREYFGKPADVWSLGVVLFALVCSRFPFKGKDDNDLFKKIQAGDYKVSSNAGGLATNLINKLLRQNPCERPTAREILNDRWLMEY